MIADKFLADPNFSLKDGVFYQMGFSKNDFESAYIDIRKKEGRLFSGQEISTLPNVTRHHPHFNEWQIRKRSTQRLVEYLNHIKEQKTILEIGCGNGWLSHQLSKIINAQVIGLDVNATELTQAANVFQKISTLAFVMGDIRSISLPIKIDYVVMGSSAQYFPDITQLLKTLLHSISNGGEIHIIDSPFYTPGSVKKAQDRSRKYFKSHDSEMATHYYHHTWDELKTFNIELLHNPASILSKLKNKIQTDSPFPWIKITNTDGN